jgi:hypothetical protein
LVAGLSAPVFGFVSQIWAKSMTTEVAPV